MRSSSVRLACLTLCLVLGSGCSIETPEQPQNATTPHASDDKVQPNSTEWAGRARLFAHAVHVNDMAATPTRLFATTLGQEEKLVRLNEQGIQSTFTFDFTAAPDARCYVDVSPGWNADFPADEVWVSRGRELVRLSPTGDRMTASAMLPAGQGDIAGLCFDDVGTFGYALLVLSDTGDVYALPGATSVLQHRAFLAPGGRAPSVAALSFGTHAGNLLVSYPDEDVVRGLSPNGIVSYVMGWSGVSAALTVPLIVREFGRSRCAYFTALEDGSVMRFDRTDIAALTGELLVSSLYRSGSGVITPEGVGYRSRAFSRFWGPEVATALVRRPAVTVVDVDVQPGTSHPTFVQGSTTLVPVAILSSAWFWPDQIDVGNITLAGAAAVPFGKSGNGTWVDLNEDGVVDLTLYFRPADMQTGVGDVELPLEGETLASESFRGDARVTVTAP